MSGPVVTVTLNPAIDQTVTLDTLRPGAVQHARSVRFNAGGKGVNVASCLADWGLPVVAAGILGGGNDTLFRALFADKGITDRFCRTPGATRVNIKLVHDGGTTDINLPGLVVTPETVAEMTRAVLALAGQGSLVVLAGSLPAGIAPGIYRDLTAALTRVGARVVLDTSGEPLNAALGEAATSLPFCVKPNRVELEDWLGHALPGPDNLVLAARGLLARGVGLVVVSLGEKGALFVSGKKALLASLPIAGASTVGAGDAMVAGIVAALHSAVDLEGTARLATAFAAGKLGLPGPNLPPHAELEMLAKAVRIAALGNQ